MDITPAVKRSVEEDVTACFRKHWFVDHAAHEFAEERGKIVIREKPRRSYSRSAPHPDWSFKPRRFRA